MEPFCKPGQRSTFTLHISPQQTWWLPVLPHSREQVVVSYTILSESTKYQIGATCAEFDLFISSGMSEES